MKLENTTPLAADLQVRTSHDPEIKVACLVAKATYRWNDVGAVLLDCEDPFRIFGADQETELGLLPNDLLPRQDSAFEVILLGKAYAPGGAAARMTISLTVGEVRRDMTVTGDRSWEGKGDASRIASPELFAEMPLAWEQAFGGRVEVLIDKDSPIDLAYSMNPEGKGFNPDEQMAELAAFVKAPDGYPCSDSIRQLPNLERPGELIERWDDQPPSPVCWATVPQVSAMQAARSVQFPTQVMDEEEATLKEMIPTFGPGLLHRAVDEWIIDLPRRGAIVSMSGLTPAGAEQFALPSLQVLADYQIGRERGSLQLSPQLLMLLPEHHAFYLVYRSVFGISSNAGPEQGVRLRTGEGWFANPGSNEPPATSNRGA